MNRSRRTCQTCLIPVSETVISHLSSFRGSAGEQWGAGFHRRVGWVVKQPQHWGTSRLLGFLQLWLRVCSAAGPEGNGEEGGRISTSGTRRQRVAYAHTAVTHLRCTRDMLSLSWVSPCGSVLVTGIGPTDALPPAFLICLDG